MVSENLPWSSCTKCHSETLWLDKSCQGVKFGGNFWQNNKITYSISGTVKIYIFLNFYPLMNEIKLNEMFLTVQLVGKCAVESD